MAAGACDLNNPSVLIFHHGEHEIYLSSQAALNHIGQDTPTCFDNVRCKRMDCWLGILYACAAIATNIPSILYIDYSIYNKF